MVAELIPSLENMLQLCTLLDIMAPQMLFSRFQAAQSTFSSVAREFDGAIRHAWEVDSLVIFLLVSRPCLQRFECFGATGASVDGKEFRLEFLSDRPFAFFR